MSTPQPARIAMAGDVAPAWPRGAGASQRLPSFRLTHWPWASDVSWEGSVRMASRDRSSPTDWASPPMTAVSGFTQFTRCAVCLWKGSLSSLWVLIVSLTWFFKRAALHRLEKLRCNWHTALCKFNTYDVLISYIYISKDDYHLSVS